MNQKVGLCFACGAKCQLLVCAVQWVAGLEGHNFAPAHLAEIGTQFIWCVALCTEIIVNRLLDTSDWTAQVDLARLIVQIVYSGVRIVVRAKYLFGFFGFVWLPTIGDRHRTQNNTLLIAQCNILAKLDGCCKIFRNVERDWHWPKFAGCKTHVVYDTVVVILG